MILVDTNIIIEYWKNPEQAKTDIFNTNEIAICPVILAELIHGAKSDKQKAWIKEGLSELHMISIDDDTWDYFGDLLYKLRVSGITVPFQDALIAAVAVKSDCLLWTQDKHFSMISSAEENLKLFELSD